MATSHVIIVSASKSKAIVLYICFCGTHINEPNVVRQLKPKPHYHQKVYYTPSQNIHMKTMADVFSSDNSSRKNLKLKISRPGHVVA